MATVEENLQHWTNYPWPAGGDEWSTVWGDSSNLWWGTLYPRIGTYIPAGLCLEIAPGFGRLTQYLKEFSKKLVGVDLTLRCVEACQSRFADSPHVSIHANDGKSLPMLEDGTVDFAFSFDSLVHAESDVLRAYVEQLALKLSPEGVVFFHHSHIGHYVDPATGQLPFENRHWRAQSMTAHQFVQFCEAVGLVCITQEIVNWGSERLTDCFSVATRPGSRHDHPYRLRENPGFMLEAVNLGTLRQLYRP